MAQQTAMQALVELMKINDIYVPCMPYLMQIIDEVYLPMEKEQLKDAYWNGTLDMEKEDAMREAEDFYNAYYSK